MVNSSARTDLSGGSKKGNGWVLPGGEHLGLRGAPDALGRPTRRLQLHAPLCAARSDNKPHPAAMWRDSVLISAKLILWKMPHFNRQGRGF